MKPCPEPSRRMLRLFAASWSVLCVLVVCVVDRLPPGSLAGWMLFGLALLFAAGLLMPRLMVGPYRLVDRLLAPVGKLFALLMLALVYFGVFTPFAVVLRLLRWDPLRLRQERWGRSAWVARSTDPAANDYHWQY